MALLLQCPAATSAQERADVGNLNRISGLPSGFEVFFESLFNAGRGLAFPCDRDGRVDLDRLSEAARNNYLFARAMIGREYSLPNVRELALA